MDPRQTKLLQRDCKRCRQTYSTEVPLVLRGGEFWPSRCPSCGKLEVECILPAQFAVVVQAAETHA